MPVNVSPDFVIAEREYSNAQTPEERIVALERMISFAPAHKGGENLRAQLRARYKKLTESLEKSKKAGKSTRQGIKKADTQTILVGPPNSGKSTIFKKLTGQNILITDYPHSTIENTLGTIDFEDIKIQIIDTPSFPNTDKGLLHTTDTILLTIDKLGDLEGSIESIGKTYAKIILAITKIDSLSPNEKRKVEATLKSKFKKYDYILFEKNMSLEELENIKRRIFQTFPIIRVYTKEPRKEHSKDAVILKKGSRIKEVAEKISKSLKNKIRSAKIWGPSAKFPGQPVGLNHQLKDKDIVEMKLD